MARFTNYRRDFYDPAWRRINVAYAPNSDSEMPAPTQLSAMLHVAEALGAEFDFVRVDFYDQVRGQIKFGEMTHYPEGGLDRFVPAEFDTQLGRLWELPKLR
jgi:hypothetical protein